MGRQRFGGLWTELKLDCLRRYLEAYAQVMKKQDHLRTHYIDAFAGTGYVELRASLVDEQSLFEDMENAESASRTILQGSAERALEVRPTFDSFTFIEQSQWRTRELTRLTQSHPEFASSINIVQGDANQELRRMCSTWNPVRDRAVVFLDPFGMSVEWATLEAISQSQSMDVWYLFPIMAVNRLLPKSRGPLDLWEQRLTSVFGTPDWRTSFYSREREITLLDFCESSEQAGSETERKTGDWDDIRDFFLSQLRRIFHSVADNPRFLCNSTGSPMFLLCFAASNPRGTAGEIALRIAQHILRVS